VKKQLKGMLESDGLRSCRLVHRHTTEREREGGRLLTEISPKGLLNAEENQKHSA
jgi:hypothetical protein